MLENFIMIAQQVLVLFILIGVGFACGKKRILTDESSKKITDIVLYVVTPCVMISAFQREFSMELLGNILITALCASAIIVMTIFISKLVFHNKNEARKKVLQFSTIFSNCGFMSLPLQKAILGNDGWFYGSIFVAIFNIIVWTYGLVMMSGDKKQMSIKKLAFNPGIVGVLIALILFVLKIKLPYIISQPVDYLAALNTPLPMLIIGFYLSQANLKKAFSDAGVYLAMAVRLVAVPLLSTVVMWLLKVDTTIMITCVIASSAPTAATTTMFAAKYSRDVELSVSVVASTTLVSIITMPLVVALAQTM
ncbi:MAG: AEC family transporter [Ruminococcus sp.]|nr:AEC family transporter [Ruminococcus sp.]